MSQGFSVGERTKKVKIEIDEGEYIDRQVNIQEAVVAMPLYHGRDMQHKAHKDKFSYGSMTFAETAATLCTNLAHLHSNNIIHSDLKPANIIWCPINGHANIVDFNRAKFISPNEQHVYSSHSSDQSYMAPDCFTDRGYRFSKASDLYSLGKILTEQFDMTHKTGRIETLSTKNYLSYDQLLIKSFLEQMTASDESQRPTINEATAFFKQIGNKMRLDTEHPEDQARLALNKKIISLEVYANELRGEMKAKNRFDENKTKKYVETIKTIELLTRALSTPQVDKQLIVNHQNILQQARTTRGFFSFKNKLDKINEEIGQAVVENKEENSQSSSIIKK